tara:strand:- start:393 stop:611 length:219 start_codon:yes stop_codon:yes gene_type:complete
MPKKKVKLSDKEINEIIFMALADDVSFDSIKNLYGIDNDMIKRIMKQNISFGSYKKWRQRVKTFTQRREHYK